MDPVITPLTMAEITASTTGLISSVGLWVFVTFIGVVSGAAFLFRRMKSGAR